MLPVKLNLKEGFLHILVRANLKEDPKVTGSAHALFVTGFYIKEPGKVGAFSLLAHVHRRFLFALPLTTEGWLSCAVKFDSKLQS